MYAQDKGELYEAYELFIAAGLYNSAHDIAVLELAPDAVLRRDLDLIKSLFGKFVGRPVDGWHVRGKVCIKHLVYFRRGFDWASMVLGLLGLCAYNETSARTARRTG